MRMPALVMTVAPRVVFIALTALLWRSSGATGCPTIPGFTAYADTDHIGDEIFQYVAGSSRSSLRDVAALCLQQPHCKGFNSDGVLKAANSVTCSAAAGDTGCQDRCFYQRVVTTHTMLPGETLSALAALYNITLEQLMALNPSYSAPQATLLTTIIVPASTGSAECAPRSYTAAPGVCCPLGSYLSAPSRCECVPGTRLVPQVNLCVLDTLLARGVARRFLATDTAPGIAGGGQTPPSPPKPAPSPPPKPAPPPPRPPPPPGTVSVQPITDSNTGAQSPVAEIEICSRVGSSDFLGLGVRIGTYLTWVTTTIILGRFFWSAILKPKLDELAGREDASYKKRTIRELDEAWENDLGGVAVTTISLLLASCLAITYDLVFPSDEMWDVNIIGISILASWQCIQCAAFMYLYCRVGKTKWRVYLLACSWYLGLQLYFWSVGYTYVPNCEDTYVPAPWFAATKVDAYGWYRILFLVCLSVASFYVALLWSAFSHCCTPILFIFLRYQPGEHPGEGFYGLAAGQMFYIAFSVTICAPLFTEFFLRYNDVEGVGWSSLTSLGQSIAFFVALVQFLAECWPLLVAMCPCLKDAPLPDDVPDEVCDDISDSHKASQ